MTADEGPLSLDSPQRTRGRYSLYTAFVARQAEPYLLLQRAPLRQRPPEPAGGGAHLLYTVCGGAGDGAGFRHCQRVFAGRQAPGVPGGKIREPSGCAELDLPVRRYHPQGSAGRRGRRRRRNRADLDGDLAGIQHRTRVQRGLEPADPQEYVPPVQRLSGDHPGHSDHPGGDEQRRSVHAEHDGTHPRGDAVARRGGFHPV